MGTSLCVRDRIRWRRFCAMPEWRMDGVTSPCFNVDRGHAGMFALQVYCKMEQKYLVIDNYFICNMATRTVKWLLFPLEGPPVRLAPLPRLLPSHGGLPAHAPGATRRSAADGAPPCFEKFGKIGRSPTYIEKHEETQCQCLKRGGTTLARSRGATDLGGEPLPLRARLCTHPDR